MGAPYYAGGMRRLVPLAAWSCIAISGCGRPAEAPRDASTVDAAESDANIDDAERADAATMDTATEDAGTEDAADANVSMDAMDAEVPLDGAMDASDAPSDAPPLDAPLEDAGPVDGAIVRTADPPTHPLAVPIAPFTECAVTTATDVISGAEHLVPCAPIAYPFLPPSSGPHYGSWAAFHTYAAPVPWGYLVHAMEHGAVILAYHCAADVDCDPVRTEFAAIITDRGLDPVCRAEDTPQRIIVVPDPTLAVPIAAVAWRNVYTATCLDPVSLRAFVEAHYAMSPENFCFPGVDLSATSWCP